MYIHIQYGTTCWCGLSNHQAAAAQMHLVEKDAVKCRPLLGALPLSLKEAATCRRLFGCLFQRLDVEIMRGWRNSVEIVRFEISNSTKAYPSIFRAYISQLRPVISSYHHSSQEMYACKNPKPQGLEETSIH